MEKTASDLIKALAAFMKEAANDGHLGTSQWHITLSLGKQVFHYSSEMQGWNVSTAPLGNRNLLM